MLSAHPQNMRERDDEAIGWLCRTLDKGADPGSCWALTKERWPAVIERRIANKYRPQYTARANWMWRHYHVRQLAHDETPEESAKHVAAIWQAQGPSIHKAAILRKNKLEALSWVQQCLDADRAISIPGRPVMPDKAMYEALTRAIVRDIVPAY
jgi:hypothetical protein